MSIVYSNIFNKPVQINLPFGPLRGFNFGKDDTEICHKRDRWGNKITNRSAGHRSIANK